MTGIVLSAATRSSLLSAQDTASLLATTQNRLSTGKKVNSALDNPTNFFTASGLDARAGDLSSLLDGISNGVQTIQAASTGITNIQKLVDSAKSTANQALSTTITTTGSGGAYVTAATTSAIEFTLNGGTAKTATVPASGTVDQAISALNLAAGSNAFTKNADGDGIAINATGKLEITATGSLTQLGLTAGTDATGTSYYDETNNAAELTVNGLETRANLASQYNDLLTQIDQLAGDASYNGTNLLNSADATNKQHIQFNADDTSSVDVKGVDATSNGLSLSAIDLTSAGSFSANSDIKDTIKDLTESTTTLRGYASSLGSQLTVVQNRQDFSKNLINALQTGSANLTNADLNEEAANSQALSTRQSLSISALSLANTAQQGVLQLLR